MKRYKGEYWYDEKWIRNQWIKLGKTRKSICEEFNIPSSGLESAIIKYKITNPRLKKINIVCSYCNIPFHKKESKILRSKLHFCSRQHKYLYLDENREYSGYYGDNWKDLRKQVLLRDNFKCMRCGSGDKIAVHHKIPRRCFMVKEDSNYLDNLITYCLRCHRQSEFLNNNLDFSCGKGTIIYSPWLVNIYGGKETKIGENCMIGPFTEIQRGVVIGNNCRIQSHSFISTNTIIEDNVFIGHNVIFVNDRYPPRGEKFWEQTIIKKGVIIGSHTTILPCVIGERSLIGAGSVIIKDVKADSIVVGNPGREKKNF